MSSKILSPTKKECWEYIKIGTASTLGYFLVVYCGVAASFLAFAPLAFFMVGLVVTLKPIGIYVGLELQSQYLD